MSFPRILKDADGNPIPQIYDAETTSWKPNTGIPATLEQRLETIENKLNEIQQNQLSGDQKVTLNGNIMELFGATIEERPSADSVEVGTTFTLANAELDTWISNGTDWEEV